MNFTQCFFHTSRSNIRVALGIRATNAFHWEPIQGILASKRRSNTIEAPCISRTHLSDAPKSGVKVDCGTSRSLHTSLVQMDSHSFQNGYDTPSGPEGYQLPMGRFKEMMDDSTKTPLVLVACGSFSPITYLHLRMFEMAKDYIKIHDSYELVGGYLSPVSDAYKKAGLASAEHRLNMTDLATSRSSEWIMLDPWEAKIQEYTPTAVVLDHFAASVNQSGGILTKDGSKKEVHVALLAGADLIQTMSTPGVWSAKDLDHILRNFPLFIIERQGTDIEDAISSLQQYSGTIHVIQQLVQNDVSSTKVRLFKRRDMSIKYLIPAEVDEYISEHGLYTDDGSNALDREKGSKSRMTPGSSKA